MLKRLEIQCVFKELVKDIVVKGQPPTLPLCGMRRGIIVWVGEGFIPPGFIALAARCRGRVKTLPYEPWKAVYGFSNCKINALLRESLRAGHARPLPHRIAKQADRQSLTICLLFCSL